MEESLTIKNQDEAVGCLAKAKKINFLVVFLVICFAFSSWIDLIGVWVEFPILVHVLPEGWTLPSYVVVLIQCAMITPFIYTVVNKLCPGNTQRREVFMAYFIMSVGIVALLLLAFLWKYTVHFAGSERSLATLSLIFLLSMVDTTSCIVYLPYMARFQEFYIPAYIAGEEAGGLITGVVGLIQGAGGEAICANVTTATFNETLGINITSSYIDVRQREPLFSVSVFFVFLMFMMVISVVSFSLLNFSKFARREMVGKFALQEDSKLREMVEVNGNVQYPPLIEEKDKDEKDTEDVQELTQEPQMERWKLLTICGLSMWAAFFIFGLFPTLQSFSTLPYGSLTYTLGVRLICVFNPIAALSAMFFRVRSVPKLAAMIAFSSLLAAYHVYLATTSPHPPLKEHPAGSFLVIFSAVILASSCAYARACMMTLLRSEGGHKALLFGGMSLQIGVFFGGIIGFLLVNVFSLFKQEMPCAHLYN